MWNGVSRRPPCASQRGKAQWAASNRALWAKVVGPAGEHWILLYRHHIAEVTGGTDWIALISSNRHFP